MKPLFLLILTIICLYSQAQILNKFNWDVNPVTKAVVGPDAISASSSAISGAIAAPLNFGLNPGLPKADVNLVLNGAGLSVPSIDIDLYFRREESTASFFRRGSIFEFMMNNGNLTAKFTYTNNVTAAVTTINSGNIHVIPNDHLFHEYRFRYDSIVGIATVLVDGATVYTYTGVPNSGLYWTGSGNPVVGDAMDATGLNIPVLSNMTISVFASSATLPSKLNVFTAIMKNDIVYIDWSVTKEYNVIAYEIERSSGASFTKIETVRGKNPINGSAVYHTNDIAPLKGASYYRLKTIDKDAKVVYSAIVKVVGNLAAGQIKSYPNPASSYTNITLNNASAGTYTYQVSGLDGRILKAASIKVVAGTQELRIDLNGNLPSGSLVITVNGPNGDFRQSFRIAKI